MADCLFGSRDAVRSAEEHSVNLKAMTANAISGALWRNFQGNAVAGSEVEYFEARLSPALLAEVFYRKVPRLNRLFRYPGSLERATLSARLDDAIRSLGEMVNGMWR